MRLRMLDCVVCPTCGGELSLRNPTWVEPAGGGSAEAAEGVLVCERGHRFAVVGGVPRLTAEGEVAKSADAEAISASFSQAWGHFEYDDDRTWMQGVEERCRLFPKELGCSAEELRGKLVLDAGCGNASLSMGVMRRFGCEVLAADVSESVVRAHEYFRVRGCGGTHFAQADLMRPPFRKETFDVIYSSGVLHHNRNTKDALKCGGGGDEAGGEDLHLAVREAAGGGAPDQAGGAVGGGADAGGGEACAGVRVAAAVDGAAVGEVSRGGRRQEDKLNWRERMVLLMDHYTPRYRWEHTPAEVHGWFREMGYEGIETTEVRAWGFGVAARKPGAEEAREREAERAVMV